MSVGRAPALEFRRLVKKSDKTSLGMGGGNKEEGASQERGSFSLTHRRQGTDTEAKNQGNLDSYFSVEWGETSCSQKSNRSGNGRWHYQQIKGTDTGRVLENKSTKGKGPGYSSNNTHIFVQQVCGRCARRTECHSHQEF